jgi:ArsR family transcriptional regulator
MVGSRCKTKKESKKIENLARIFKIISEPNRLKILCLLKGGSKCVCDIWQCLKLPQNLVSHHLKVLKNLGLVSSKKVKQRVFYQLNKKIVKKYLKLLNKNLNSKNEKI